MKSEQRDAIRDLLTGERVLSLAVVADGAPWVGMLPYAPVGEPQSLLVHVSGLARHAAGLGEGAPVSILVHRSDDPEGDPQQLERITLTATAHPLEKGTPEYDRARKRYLGRFPQAEITFGLGDFRLVRLAPNGGRYVGGFAQALNLNERNLAEIDL